MLSGLWTGFAFGSSRKMTLKECALYTFLCGKSGNWESNALFSLEMVLVSRVEYLGKWIRYKIVPMGNLEKEQDEGI